MTSRVGERVAVMSTTAQHRSVGQRANEDARHLAGLITLDSHRLQLHYSGLYYPRSSGVRFCKVTFNVARD